MFMPSISGPSITSIGRPPRASTCWRTSSVSSTMKVVMPCTRACARRSPTGTGCSGVPRQARFSSFFAPPPLKRSAISSRRSVESSRRFRTTSSTRSRSSGSSWSYTPSWPALTMPMSMPAPMAWYRNTVWIASRTESLPRNENETLDTPPLTLAYGRFCLIQRVASMKSTA
ncbi:hypothetical protein D9M72_525460 [compost metagenome]